jgi:hypothetical protein
MSTFKSPDWTLGRYAELIEVAGRLRAFEPFGTASNEPHALWRHDIDYSIAHALVLARIEAERGARATYFVMLGSPYYNLLEITAIRQLREIVSLGHWIGLHFDPERYTQFDCAADLAEAMARERSIVADAAGTSIEAVSLHNPAFAGLLHMDQARLGGMINAYSAKYRQTYAYCSDSFGYWRYRPVHEVVADASVSRVQVLTHPIWWWPRQMGSRQRVRACVDTHAAYLRGLHDDLLTRAGQIDAVISADLARGFDESTPPGA